MYAIISNHLGNVYACKTIHDALHVIHGGNIPKDCPIDPSDNIVTQSRCEQLQEYLNNRDLSVLDWGHIIYYEYRLHIRYAESIPYGCDVYIGQVLRPAIYGCIRPKIAQ